MGLQGFRCGKCEELRRAGQDVQTEYEYEEALIHFPFGHPTEKNPAGGVVPAFMIHKMWEDAKDPRRGKDHVTPSMLPGCMREAMLARAKTHTINPLRMWKSIEGQLWHEVMWRNAAPGWGAEERVPGHADAFGVDGQIKPGFRVTEDGTIEMEWEDMWLSAVIDSSITRVGVLLIDDYKTQDCPKTNFKSEYLPPKQEAWPHETIQVNLYGQMKAQLLGLSMDRVVLRIWRYIKGIQRADFAWTPITVPIMPKDRLVREVKGNYDLFKTAYSQWVKAKAQSWKDKIIADMPLTGREMFGGKKCTQYCDQLENCNALLSLNPQMESDDV